MKNFCFSIDSKKVDIIQQRYKLT